MIILTGGLLDVYKRQDWKSTLNSMVSLDQDFSFITEGLKANVKFAFDTQAWHGNKHTQQDEICTEG